MPMRPESNSPLVDSTTQRNSCGLPAGSRPVGDDQLVRGTTFYLGIAGVLMGLLLMVWTWSRAASMSADGAHYMELAERSWRDGPMAGMDWYSGPGYPVIVGWVYGLVGDLDFAGRLTSMVFASGTLLAVAVSSYRLFGRAVACVSVGLLAVHTTFVRHAVMAETDAAYGWWLVCSILCTWELSHASKFWQRALLATLCGLCLGIGYLTRPEAVPLAGLLGTWFLWRGWRGRSMQVDTAKVGQHPSGLGPATPRPMGLGQRLAWSLVVAVVFLALAWPYLVRLRAEVGHWSLSGKERSIVLKFVPDKQHYEESLRMGVTRALLYKPSNILHWLPYHLHWGVPQFGKSLSLVVLALVPCGVALSGWTPRARGAVGLLLWVSVPFLLFFFLTFPGRRYFMQAMPQWTILASLGAIELAGRISWWRDGVRWNWTPAASRRAFRIALATPILLMIGSTLWGNRVPMEVSQQTERRVGERIHELAGPGRRVLSFTVTAFYARAERVPLWGPMEGIVRCHGYGKPLTYDDLVDYVRRNGVEYLVMDHDLRADCPDFLDRVRSDHFELVADDISDHNGAHLVYRALRNAGTLQAN